MVHTSDLMMLIRLVTRILTIITRGIGKLNAHSPIYCTKDNWNNSLNSRHKLDRMYPTSILKVQYFKTHLLKDDILSVTSLIFSESCVFVSFIVVKIIEYIIASRSNSFVYTAPVSLNDINVSSSYDKIIVLMHPATRCAPWQTTVKP